SPGFGTGGLEVGGDQLGSSLRVAGIEEAASTADGTFAVRNRSEGLPQDQDQDNQINRNDSVQHRKPLAGSLPFYGTARPSRPRLSQSSRSFKQPFTTVPPTLVSRQ